MVRGFARVGGVFGLAVLSAGGVLMMAAQQGNQPGGQPGGPPAERQPGRGGERGRGGGEFASVESAMKAMNGGMRQIKDTIGDASKKDQNLVAIGRIQLAAVYSKNNKPVHLKGGEAALEGYRKTLIELTRTLLDLESQVIAGEGEKAKETYKKLGQMQDEGHDKYIDDTPPAERGPKPDQRGPVPADKK